LKTHPYRRAALWAAILVALAWCAWWMPSKVFHSDGSPPGGYFITASRVVLTPGVVISVYLFLPSFDSPGGYDLLIALGLLLNWLLYFGLFALIARLRHRRVPEGS
jgi:hypothetical protein